MDSLPRYVAIPLGCFIEGDVVIYGKQVGQYGNASIDGCCEKCASEPHCNVWSFCQDDSGCTVYGWGEVSNNSPYIISRGCLLYTLSAPEIATNRLQTMPSYGLVFSGVPGSSFQAYNFTEDVRVLYAADFKDLYTISREEECFSTVSGDAKVKYNSTTGCTVPSPSTPEEILQICSQVPACTGITYYDSDPSYGVLKRFPGIGATGSSSLNPFAISVIMNDPGMKSSPDQSLYPLVPVLLFVFMAVLHVCKG